MGIERSAAKPYVFNQTPRRNSPDRPSQNLLEPRLRAPPIHAVLIVEDEPILRLDIAETFTSAGFRTFEAGSALEAIDILETHPEISAVFTDVEMPGTMDGIELAHVIRERWPPTILVVSSGNSFPTAYALPPHTTFIPKPYDDGALTAVVRSITGQLAHSRSAQPPGAFKLCDGSGS